MSATDQLTTKFRVPAGVVSEPLSEDELVLLDVTSHRFYSLNATGKRIFELAGQGLSERVVAERLASEFDASVEECALDVAETITALLDRGLLAAAT